MFLFICFVISPFRLNNAFCSSYRACVLVPILLSLYPLEPVCLAFNELLGTMEIDYSKLTTDQLERIAEGENVLKVILDGYIASGGEGKGGAGA